MKRLIFCDASNLDDLLRFAASYDEGRFKLDQYEVYELLTCLLSDAGLKLGKNSELRLGGVSLQRDADGTLSISLKRSGLTMKSLYQSEKQAA